MLKGVQRSSSRRVAERLPITPELMESLHLTWVPDTQPHPYMHTLLWAVACVAFFGCLRLGELTATANTPSAISADGIAIDSHSAPSVIRLSLSPTKTYPFGRGAVVYLGKTDSAVCPVRALLRYLAVRPGHRSGPLFILQEGHHLPRDLFVAQVRAALSAAGVDQSRYSGHSFRIRAATAAARAGVPDYLIKAFSRWDSEAYQLYIRTPGLSLAAISSAIAHPLRAPGTASPSS